MTTVVEFLAAVAVVRVAGMALLAFTLGSVVSLGYRTYLDARIPLYVPMIVGLGAVGLWMNTASSIVAFVESTSSEEPLVLQAVETNVAAILASGAAAVASRRAGERLAPNVRALTGARRLDTGVSTLVRTVGRFVSVTVPKPKKIEDIPDYEPVPEETKADLGGTELLFPRGLTVEQLRRRFVARLREDYGIGYVDVELAEDGSVDYLAVGSRAAGIGPTLPPRKVAVAVEADPAPTASPGDRVRVWRDTDGGAERVALADLRATTGDTATLTVDASRADALDQSGRYSLVTLPAGKQPERGFAALLRAANETMDTTTVAEGAPLVGVPVGALRPVVAAIRPADGPVETLPGRGRVCRAGDTLYVIGRPGEFRKLDALSVPPSEAAADVAPAVGAEPTPGAGRLRGLVRSLWEWR